MYVIFSSLLYSAASLCAAFRALYPVIIAGRTTEDLSLLFLIFPWKQNLGTDNWRGCLQLPPVPTGKFTILRMSS